MSQSVRISIDGIERNPFMQCARRAVRFLPSMRRRVSVASWNSGRPMYVDNQPLQRTGLAEHYS
jgi:hypothetical protein